VPFLVVAEVWTTHSRGVRSQAIHGYERRPDS
jgi:hypothetical protein